ncbi:MAG: bifunctional 5,10-methylenetetrahydrofolate dehydrogenase/5,10-methenyltetrahydrofolate cyclohydrolase [Armatimonadetes bacterium]|nr:bifunctional 5,10-methylenetetrahydrofolate dehydrogenase/5,10-methenyltetrahydrofolate cyclohydrolase [Armatimonadota bacterium]
MAAQILDGTATAKQIRADLAERVAELKSRRGLVPRLAVILVGDDPASVTYTRMKKRACEAAGMISDLIVMPADSTQDFVKDTIAQLNTDPMVHGIMVQHPVPSHLDELDILSTVAVEKDVDGISAMSLGKLVLGTADYTSCTPQGIVTLLEKYNIPIKGAEAVVVGRSIILGKPAALALLERHATVTICHSRTKNLADVVRRADIVVAALGRAEYIKGDWIKKGAVVIDAGYNKVEGRDKDVGDVEFEAAAERAGWITPVPGGVGPMTIAMLLTHTVKAAEKYG